MLPHLVSFLMIIVSHIIMIAKLGIFSNEIIICLSYYLTNLSYRYTSHFLSRTLQFLCYCRYSSDIVVQHPVAVTGHNESLEIH